MFNLDKVHIILDEMILSGHIVETNKSRILAPLLGRAEVGLSGQGCQTGSGKRTKWTVEHNRDAQSWGLRESTLGNCPGFQCLLQCRGGGDGTPCIFISS
ncbi:hypothetical protein SKAU_G00210890 [Synaphobranchus kaupii]|uniref:AP complex mu/sigma subunit domain-containing protein n=1 Tax=Synaphobranchus kaupii TaxID=118154 RepID=A0A9Q1IU12_SYNKA|nr:hypothetical protein SKAU_G00210890 [Synaphobranchus kaupii]